MHDAFRASVGEGYDEALLHSCMTLQCFFLLFFFFISPSNNASVLRKPPVPSVRMSRRTAAPLCPPVSVLLVLNWKTTWEVLFSSEAVLQNESFESFSFSSSHAQVKRASGSHWIPASFNVSTAVLPACYVHLLTNKHLTKHFFCPGLILVAYVQEVDVSASQYPRQPAYPHTFTVCIPVFQSSSHLCPFHRLCAFVSEWELHWRYMCGVHVST